MSHTLSSSLFAVAAKRSFSAHIKIVSKLMMPFSVTSHIEVNSAASSTASHLVAWGTKLI